MMRLSDNKYVYIGSVPICIHERDDDLRYVRVDYYLHYFYDFSKGEKMQHNFVCSTYCDFIVHDDDGKGKAIRFDPFHRSIGRRYFRDFEDLIRRFDDNSIRYMKSKSYKDSLRD